MTTRINQAIQIQTDGAAQVQAGLQIEVLDPSNWTPVQLMKRLLEQLEGNRVQALKDLAVQVALLDHPRQVDAADYLGISPRVVTYNKQRLAGNGQLVVRGDV